MCSVNKYLVCGVENCLKPDVIHTVTSLPTIRRHYVDCYTVIACVRDYLEIPMSKYVLINKEFSNLFWFADRITVSQSEAMLTDSWIWDCQWGMSKARILVNDVLLSQWRNCYTMTTKQGEISLELGCFRSRKRMWNSTRICYGVYLNFVFLFKWKICWFLCFWVHIIIRYGNQGWF